MPTKITWLHLRMILDYSRDTGVFVWKINRSKAVKAGHIAGCREKRIGYITIGVDGKVYKAHRLAWLYVHLEWPDGLIDHINGDKSDNRIENLRVVAADGNSQNVRKPNRRNKSGFMGVIWFQNKWRATMSLNGKSKWLGDYSTPEEAHQVYLEAKRKYHAACTI
jgi:hypothetical protein